MLAPLPSYRSDVKYMVSVCKAIYLRKIIEDNLNSEFKCFHTLRESTGQYTVFTYTVIEANIDNYELRLDGEIVEWD